jgi:hypothetical protein
MTQSSGLERHMRTEVFEVQSNYKLRSFGSFAFIMISAAAERQPKTTFQLFISDRQKCLKTLLMWSGTLTIGLSMAIVGVTLMDLQQQIHTDLSSISLLLPARSAGYVIGSLSCEYFFFLMCYSYTTALQSQ